MEHPGPATRGLWGSKHWGQPVVAIPWALYQTQPLAPSDTHSKACAEQGESCTKPSPPLSTAKGPSRRPPEHSLLFTSCNQDRTEHSSCIAKCSLRPLNTNVFQLQEANHSGFGTQGFKKKKNKKLKIDLAGVSWSKQKLEQTPCSLSNPGVLWTSLKAVLKGFGSISQEGTPRLHFRQKL